MQVKKFEARTMKEALEMVKKQLGPEAIILGARDNRKSFGLVGEGSVEITAAISEDVLQKKKFTESRMRPQEREKFQTAPAKVQKNVMEKFVQNYQQQNPQRKPLTQTRYIEIDDPQAEAAELAQERIKSAAQRAWNAMQAQAEWAEEVVDLDAMAAPAPRAKAPAAPPKSSEVKDSEILALKSELEGLKQVLSHFQKVPQNMVNPHPGSEFGLSYEFSSTFEKLTQAGVLPEIAAEILGVAQTQMPPVRFKNKALVDAWTARYILDSTLVVGEKPASRVQIFVGPAGSGKTSSMVKMAAHAAVRNQKKVVLLTADTFKVGASDQMRIYAQILNVPFAVIRKQSDWTYLLRQLQGYDQIFCDFPGMGLKSIEEITRLKSLLPPEDVKSDVHLVLSSTAKNQDLFEIGKRFKAAHFSDVIFSALDESVQHGNIYNFMKHFQVPLHSFGIGPRVPEDYEMATAERVLDLIFKLSKLKKAQE